MTISGQLSLKQRVFKAGMWSFAGFGLSLVIRFGSNLLMTRLLLPEMFGVMAIATTVMIGLAMFSDVGLKPSVVQNKRGDDPAFLNTAWVTQILRGLLLGVLAASVSLLIIFAGYLHLVPKRSIYDDASLPYVIAALSLTAVIAGLESTKLLQASRNLLLAKVTRIEIAAQITGLIVMVAWVFTDRSVWALVAGALASSSLRTILSHIWLPGTANRWQWEQEAFDEIMRFGKWIFLSSVLYFLVSNGDRMLLGGLIDASSLGTYAIAFLIFGSVDQVLTKIIVDVSFPALSEIVRERSDKVTESYYRFHAVIASFSYFCCGILMVSGQAIIGLLYDRRYEQAGWILEILAVALLSLPFRMATQCFLAFDRARFYFFLHTIRVATLFVALPLGFHLWGLQGAVWGVVLSYFSSVPLVVYYAVPLGLFNLRKEILALLAVIVGVISGEIANAIIALIVRGGLPGQH